MDLSPAHTHTLLSLDERLTRSALLSSSGIDIIVCVLSVGFDTWTSLLTSAVCFAQVNEVSNRATP